VYDSTAATVVGTAPAVCFVFFTGILICFWLLAFVSTPSLLQSFVDSLCRSYAKYLFVRTVPSSCRCWLFTTVFVPLSSAEYYRGGGRAQRQGQQWRRLRPAERGQRQYGRWGRQRPQRAVRRHWRSEQLGPAAHRGRAGCQGALKVLCVEFASVLVQHCWRRVPAGAVEYFVFC
jgi:hypothetical protein